MPTVPVIGVEDAANRDKNPYWLYAWYTAALPVPYPKIMRHTKKSIGLAVNPVTYRSQHQLHIHIGRTKYFLRNARHEDVPHDGHWHKITPKKVHKKTCYAKLVKYIDPDAPNFPSPFKEVSKHFGESNMKHAGIILAGDVDDNDSLKGFYIVSCYDTWVEDMFLNFSCDAN